MNSQQSFDKVKAACCSLGNICVRVCGELCMSFINYAQQ